MDFAAHKTALSERGFSHFSDTLRGSYVNAARAELDDSEWWPYRQKTTAGAAPLAIADLGVIEHVLDTNQSSIELHPATFSGLVSDYGDVGVDGTPVFFYVRWSSGTPTVHTYPDSTAALSVRHFKVTVDLSAGGDAPAAPSRFHSLIVDMAVQRAYRDMDNHQAAEALQVQIDRDLTRMRASLLTEQVQGPGMQVISGASQDW